jgi:hypothetical protein
LFGSVDRITNDCGRQPVQAASHMEVVLLGERSVRPLITGSDGRLAELLGTVDAGSADGSDDFTTETDVSRLVAGLRANGDTDLPEENVVQVRSDGELARLDLSGENRVQVVVTTVLASDALHVVHEVSPESAGQRSCPVEIQRTHLLSCAQLLRQENFPSASAELLVLHQVVILVKGGRCSLSGTVELPLSHVERVLVLTLGDGELPGRLFVLASAASLHVVDAIGVNAPLRPVTCRVDLLRHGPLVDAVHMTDTLSKHEGNSKEERQEADANDSQNEVVGSAVLTRPFLFPVLTLRLQVGLLSHAKSPSTSVVVLERGLFYVHATSSDSWKQVFRGFW